MLGNDIVDLQLASVESNWKRTGYLQKIFSSKEMDDIHSSIDPDKKVWLYWSMKETAYKCINRALQYRFYNPAKLTCAIDELSDNSDMQGIVQYQDFKIETYSRVTPEYISTFVRDPNIDHYKKTLQLDSVDLKNPKQALRRKILAYLDQNNSQSASRFSILKDALGIPSLLDRKKDKTLPISISHHGRFGSFILPFSTLD